MKSRRSLPILMTLALGALSAACGSDSTDDGNGAAGGTSTGGSTGDSPLEGSGGSPAVDPSYSWADKTFVLDVPKSHWTEPGGVGEEVGDFVPPFLISVGACTAEACTVTLGTAVNLPPESTESPSEQELCNVTTVAAPITAAPPGAISIGPLDLPMFIRHLEDPIAVAITVRELTMTNVLPSAAGAAGVSKSGVLLATVDIRELYPMFTDLSTNPTADGVCGALPQLDPEATCQPCADQAAYCLSLKAEMLGAVEFTGAFQTLAAPAGTDCSTVI